MLDPLLHARGLTPLPLYPVESVATILGITTPSVRRLIRQGRLQAIRRRRSIIGVTHAALDGYLGANPEEGAAA